MNKFIYTDEDAIEFDEIIAKHGTHDQSTHGNWAKNRSAGDGTGHPTQTSHPEFRPILADYIAEYPQNIGHQWANHLLRLGEENYLKERVGGDWFDLYSHAAGVDPTEHLANQREGYKQDFAEVVEIASKLDKLVSLSPPLTEDTTVYRGVSEDFAGELARMGVGGTFTDNGFVSTTLRKEIAMGFPSVPSGNLMQVEVPQGVRAIVPSKYFKSNIIRDTNLSKEKEIILGRGNTFEITKIEQEPKYKQGIIITTRLVQ
jgi:hypothetical protein